MTVFPTTWRLPQLLQDFDVRKAVVYSSMAAKILEGFTFDDVLLRPLASAMEPAEASLKTKIAGIDLTVPFLSAAMDRVTGPEMAIAMGRVGGLGVLHRNCSVEEQAAMVEKVKKAGVR